MIGLIGGIFAALLPAAVLWIGFPRKPWVPIATAILCVGAAVAALTLTPAARNSILIGCAANILCGVLGGALLWRRRADYRETVHRLDAVRSARAKLAADLAVLKTRGLNVEREHRETVAVYGLVKGLAESLTWDDARPRLEAALEQYFGAQTAFALHVAGVRGDADVWPLVVKGLRASPGAKWDTLRRMMQEQGATDLSAKVFKTPELSVGVPVREGSDLLGYLYVRLPDGADEAVWVEKCRLFASELVVAFKRVKLFQQMERLSEIDGLTGVRLRGAFDRRLADEIIRARTFKTTFGLMLLDIDHFKSFNDRYGHQVGDQVLKAVGETLNSAVYETDFVARYGGEEFVVLLPRAEPAGALRKAEMIRSTIAARKVAVGFENLNVTVSIGIAHFPRDASSAEELIARADAAMYAAKSGGRNRIVDCEVLRG